jgi:hypothetical protein
MKNREEDVSECGLTFSVTTERIDHSHTEHLLKAYGDAILVTNENLDEYINLYGDYLMNSSVAEQFAAFKTGFLKIATNHVFGILLYDELDIIVSGSDIMNWDELRVNARYMDGYTSQSPLIIWFWEVFHELTDGQKKQRLRFATGSDRIASGLSYMRLAIQRTGDPSKLPVAHTCFGVLGVPEYPTKTLLKQNLMIALENTEGFGLV